MRITLPALPTRRLMLGTCDVQAARFHGYWVCVPSVTLAVALTTFCSRNIPFRPGDAEGGSHVLK